jgi:predicted GNAT family acetyltransferase
MEQLKVYDDAKRFWDEVSPFLRREEAKNSLCLGLSYTFRSNPEDCVYQSALFNDDTLLGAIVVSRYRTNVNFLPTPIASSESAQKLFDSFKKASIAVTGIVGELQTAKTYQSLLEECGHRTRVHLKQGIYRCRQVIHPRASEKIHFRKADQRDIPIIGEWIEAFHKEAVPHDPPVNGVEQAETRIKKEMIFVVEQGGDLVSMSCWSRDIETSCSVNLVYTPQALRKQGFASIATAKLTQHLFDSGKSETNLYTDMLNPTSNKIYQEIGYEFVCDSIHYGVCP